ncbi:hypothetical protein N9Y92_03925 [Chlamydiales bacterium]|nr:hypothetical protein [Chlamydiales bacterium]
MRLLMLPLLFLSSCSPTPSLTVYSHYRTHKELASYHVGTPDPRLRTINNVGQSLVFDWRVPQALLKTKKISIVTALRLKDHQSRTFIIPINCQSGQTTWDLLGQDYITHRGIFTFISTLYADDIPLKTVTHPLYTPLIETEYTQNN